jgi:methylated-DNA-[protein]-cysteine S-methyltransferase
MTDQVTRTLKGARGANVDRRVRAASSSLVDQADNEGLLDVAYAWVDSPVGALLLAGTKSGLATVSFTRGPDDDYVLDELATKISPRLLEAPARLDDARRELDEYFDGRRKNFDVKLDWRLIQGFGKRVLRATARIPYGKTSSYQAVAAEAGSPSGSRAAGNALGANPLPIVVPCHRVLRTGGAIGGYGGGLDKKRLLLELEGAL